MNELIINLDIFESVEKAILHGLNELLTGGANGWRTTGMRKGAYGTIIAAKTGNGLSFSYLEQGSELSIYYFKSEVDQINTKALNSIDLDPAEN